MPRALVTKDMEMAKVSNAFLSLVFTGMTYLQESQAPDTHGKSEAMKTYHWWRRVRLGNIRET